MGLCALDLCFASCLPAGDMALLRGIVIQLSQPVPLSKGRHSVTYLARFLAFLQPLPSILSLVLV